MNKNIEMKEKVYNYIIENKLFENGDSCIVGVSGGADSICLLSLLSELAGKLDICLYAVHVNHMIRGDEADEDERYVESYCKALGVLYKAFHIDVTAFAKEEGLTVEEAGRNARYKAFDDAAATFGLKNYKIAVAHNKNDVVETVILNMARGTGISGIKGIPAKRENIVRPLLCVEREEIESYLNEANIKYRTDSTNLSDDYTRNKIRHNIVPELTDINERAICHVARLAETAAECDRYINACADKFINESSTEKVLITGENVIEIGIDELRHADNLIENTAILKLIAKAAGKKKDIGDNHLREVKKLYDAKAGSFIMLPYGIRAVNNYGKLRLIYGKKREQTDFNIEVTSPGIYTSPDGSFRVKIEIFDKPVNIDLTKKEYTKLVDYDKIQNGIAIRNYKEDDYMVISSDGSRKKMNRLFSSEKIPIDERDYVPLVTSGHEVIWAVGMRLAENYKVSKDTKRVISFDFEYSEKIHFCLERTLL